MNTKSGWIGFDFDATLATYNGWVGSGHTGEPILPMIQRLQAYYRDGYETRIFTARVYPLNRCVRPQDLLEEEVENVVMEQAITAVHAIRSWSLSHLGFLVPITNIKDYGMIRLYDDRAVGVRPNTGILVGSPDDLRANSSTVVN